MKEIKQLLAITNSLKEKHHRNFTLDGKLVGDIGEVLVAEKYGLKLLVENEKLHDAEELASGRMVQIKSSFGGRSYFPCGDVPDYYIGIHINEDGTFEELFNGPGAYIVENYILKRNLQATEKRYLYNLSGNVLRELNANVPATDKINEVQ